MKNRGRLLCVPAIIMASVIALSAQSGWRAPTPKEKTFYEQTMRAISQSIPAVPAGWLTISQTEIKDLDRVFTGSEKEPFQISYIVEWQDLDKKNSGDQKTVQALTDYQKNHPDKELEALTKERDSLYKEGLQASAKNDSAKVTQIMEKMESINEKMKGLSDAQQKKYDEIIAANEAHDYHLTISITVNAAYDARNHQFRYAYGKIKSAPPVSGNLSFVTDESKNNKTLSEQREYVVLGKNLKMTEAYEQNVLTSGRISTADYPSVYVIQVSVQGDSPRARKTLESINWKTLGSLIK
jgi:hypothetical protein